MPLNQDPASTHAAARETDFPPPSFPVLPEELICEILVRVPVRNLLRFRCVCKSWKSLISHPHFSKKHLHRSTMDPNSTHHRINPSRHMDYYGLSVSVHYLFNNPSSPVPVYATIPVKYKYCAIETCHGLLCLFARGGERVKLCNPTTRLSSKKSPPCGGYPKGGRTYILFGFGYDYMIDNYKVVSVFCDLGAERVLDKTLVRVYTFGDKSWRKIQSFPHLPILGNNDGKYVSGALNWVVTRAADIDYFEVKEFPLDELLLVSLDMGNESYKEMLLPNISDDKLVVRPRLEVLKDCLCFYYDNCCREHFVVWIMREYRVKESWSSWVTISYQQHGPTGKYEFLTPLFMSGNDEILLQIKLDELVLYNPTDNIMRCCLFQRDDMYWLDPRIYLESLVSPCR